MKRLLLGLGLILFASSLRAAVTTDNIKYSADVALNCPGFNALANSATVGASCSYVDNSVSTATFVDAFVTVISSTGAGAVAAPSAVYVYVYGSEDGSNYEQEESSSPINGGSYTINATTIFRVAAFIPVANPGKQYVKTFFIAPLFGGSMPRKWGIILINQTGQTLGTSGNSVSYSGITYTNQ